MNTQDQREAQRWATLHEVLTLVVSLEARVSALERPMTVQPEPRGVVIDTLAPWPDVPTPVVAMRGKPKAKKGKR